MTDEWNVEPSRTNSLFTFNSLRRFDMLFSPLYFPPFAYSIALLPLHVACMSHVMIVRMRRVIRYRPSILLRNIVIWWNTTNRKRTWSQKIMGETHNDDLNHCSVLHVPKNQDLLTLKLIILNSPQSSLLYSLLYVLSPSFSLSSLTHSTYPLRLYIYSPLPPPSILSLSLFHLSLSHHICQPSCKCND